MKATVPRAFNFYCRTLRLYPQTRMLEQHQLTRVLTLGYKAKKKNGFPSVYHRLKPAK